MIKPWTENEIASTREWWAAGVTQAEIGRRLGRNSQSVCGIVRRHKMPWPSSAAEKAALARETWTDERRQLLARTFPDTRTDLIVVAINELSGPTVTADDVAREAKRLELRRHPVFRRAIWSESVAKAKSKQLATAAERRRTAPKPPAPPPVSTAADVDEFIARRGVTRLPAAVAYGADTRVQLPPDDARAVAAYEDEKYARGSWRERLTGAPARTRRRAA